MPEVEKGQVYEVVSTTRYGTIFSELVVVSDPAMGTVRGRRMLSVDTMTQRINRRGVASFARLRLLRERQCVRCAIGDVEHDEPTDERFIAAHRETVASHHATRERLRRRKSSSSEESDRG